ncbi:hypothetical protein [Zoogloea sp. LCSB751]|uniref:hypothetical protein n=1 Tax=Zoogloea sp. LCSB751 TaxID=1965277 RepID=UPI001116EE7F|nr:hypothetical protein [Zoogloea sp. LCSB751]
MKQTILISIITALAVGLAASVFTSFEKAKEIEQHKEKITEVSTELQKYKTENKKLRAVASILDGATNGIHKTQPEIIKNVNKVVAYILNLKDAPEEKFKECWDRRLNTTSWGSDGPYGLLDECIDSIKSSSSAILIREIDNATNAARSRCSEGNDRYEMAKNCWADRNFRLMSSANQVIFLAITTQNWLDTQDISINER